MSNNPTPANDSESEPHNDATPQPISDAENNAENNAEAEIKTEAENNVEAEVDIDNTVEVDDIIALKEELQNKQDEFLRAKAETDNVRRRGIEDRVKAQKFAIESFANNLLPIVDALTAATANKSAPVDKVLEGVAMTQKLLTEVLEKHGVKMIASLDEKFNPAFHQAIAMEPADGEANRVISVMQEGYTLQERILRPSMVIVSQAKSE